ncbi:hypothetical protein Q8G50_33495, partial [Klebsiella pneumoniae]
DFHQSSKQRRKPGQRSFQIDKAAEKGEGLDQFEVGSHLDVLDQAIETESVDMTVAGISEPVQSIVEAVSVGDGDPK